jgi:hypothetical protein
MKQPKSKPSGGVEYVNRKEDTYYLQAGKTKTGKPKYYLARKITGVPLDRVPEGYEIYESPATAVAVVRKAKPSRIHPEERRLVEERSRALSGMRHIIVDVEPDALVIYTPGMSESDAEGLFGSLGTFGGRKEAAKDAIMSQSVYMPMLRFALFGEVHRTFVAQRWCFRGGIDGWILLSGPRPLADHVAELAPHLGKESFFELL